jgi:hypothetical protein
MQQTVLLTAIRGPDGMPKYGAIKMLLRWYRRCILISSLDACILDNPTDVRGGSFMGPSYARSKTDSPMVWHAQMDEIVSEYLRTLDAIPHHFQLHLIHAFEIVGYKHPEKYTQKWFQNTYRRLVRDMHLEPETEETLDHRLGDNRTQWLMYNDAATVE